MFFEVIIDDDGERDRSFCSDSLLSIVSIQRHLYVVPGSAIDFLSCLLLLTFLSLDACAADEDEEYATGSEAAHHDIPRQALIVSHKVHCRAEDVEKAFAHDRLHELEVPHDELKLTERDE